jgi:hypothetical protein
MTDYGSFTVQSNKLREAADIWSDCAADTWRVYTDISPAVGQGDKFGILAGSSGVSASYDTWVEAMATAARTASKNFYYLKAALESTANGYDGADDTSATSMRTLDGMIDHG